MKVDFIICTNSDLWYSECVKYIENLIVPDNVEIGVIGITDASSMTEGYEAGRNSSEADYKVYLHQDTFIINRHFIEDIHAVFQSDDRIGVIGMCGSDDVENQRLSWGNWRWGKVIGGTGIRQLLLKYGGIAGNYQVADCLDGMILVTRYDVPWRQDILTGWHFYDRSLCLEYRRRGYLCVVPRQESPWCIHACGISELGGWNDSLPAYLDEYQDFFNKEEILKNIKLPDQNEIQRSHLAADKMEGLINNRKMDEAVRFREESVDSGARLNKRLIFLGNLLEIWKTGRCSLFFAADDKVSDMWMKYIRAYFLLQRKIYGLPMDGEEILFLSKLTAREKSVVLQHELTLHSPAGRNAAEVMGFLEQVWQKSQNLLEIFGNANVNAEDVSRNAATLAIMIEMLDCMIPLGVYEKYSEFFSAFSIFCRQCGNAEFLLENVEEMVSSLELFEECVDDLYQNYRKRIKKCPCCGHEVMYTPLPDYYDTMEKRYQVATESEAETLNKEEYLCPKCGACDRDRLIISYLDKEGLQESSEETKLLQIAPSAAISRWIYLKCPHIKYDTTDLYMDKVSFQSDIMDMYMVPDETYDVIICSHVLEHVRDDQKALSELKRILKPDGKIVFLVPIDLNASGIDEEWGLPEAENWRRFGQGDHCRRYDKKGLQQRLEEQFYVHSLGKEYFGEELFRQCGLTDTSTLYLLTKSEEVSLNMAEEVAADNRLCTEGPLVTVVMSCYNHGAFVAEAIESVINQTYKNIEFLVADDGSSDDSVSVMQRYSDHFSKEFYFKENIGGRFYFLVEQARGKYIALMNSDDVWEKDKLALQVKYMEEHEECGACFTWCKYTDENLVESEDETFRRGNRSSREWMLYFWQHGNALCNPSSLIRKEFCIKKPKYGSACWQLPDFFRWIELVQLTSIHIIPKFFIKMRRYNKNGLQNTSSFSKENMQRHCVEEGHNWFWVIRDMEDAFFKEVFGDLMVNPQASTEQEIKCEKYFLMLNHPNPFLQNGALCYFSEIYNDVEVCMKEKYFYTIIDFKKEIISKGLV